MRCLNYALTFLFYFRHCLFVTTGFHYSRMTITVYTAIFCGDEKATEISGEFDL